MKPAFSLRVRLAALIALAVPLASLACTASTDGAASCESVCDSVPDCGSSSCMAQCSALESACTEEGQRSAFTEWATCRPTLACEGGALVPVTCRGENAAIMACGTTLITMNLPASAAVACADGGSCRD
jgi:hypothetical protein